MAVIDEIHEVFRPAVAAGHGKIARPLIAPGAVKGIFAQRHELDMGIMHIFHVVYQLVCQFPVGQHIAVFFAPPRAQVDFIGQHGLGV